MCDFLKSIYENEPLKDLFILFLSTVFGGISGHFFSKRQDNRNRKFDNDAKLLDTVYQPIDQIIEDGILLGDVYEGLDQNQVNQIIKIIKDNASIADKKLLNFKTEFDEEFALNLFDDDLRYDLDCKFAVHVDKMLKKLRRRLLRNSHDSHWQAIKRNVIRPVRRFLRGLLKYKRIFKKSKPEEL